MVHFGSTCIHRLSNGKRRLEVQFHRLIHNPKVTVNAIFKEGSEQAAAACAGRHVLAIQDTSEINFRTTSERRRGLGLIGKGVGRGLLLHPMIGIDADTQDCLGLVGGQIWTRDPSALPKKRTKDGKKKKFHHKLKLSDKESRRWVETATAAKMAISTAAMVTMIADREADIYQMWALVPDQKVHVLGRAYHDRILVGGGTLTTSASQWPVLGTRTILIRERQDRPEREAVVELRFGKVTIPRPKNILSKEELPKQVTLTLIELKEIAPPKGAEPVVWRLLTTHDVPNQEMAWQVVDWYRCRWIIEQFFRILKQQGLKIEDSQIDDAKHLIKLTAIATRAAITTLQLVQARDGHGSLPALLIFDPNEMAMLEKINLKYTGKTLRQQNPHPPGSLAWAAWIIARLGGWDGYPSSRPPGPITFKRGLDALKMMATGWALRDLCMP